MGNWLSFYGIILILKLYLATRIIKVVSPSFLIVYHILLKPNELMVMHLEVLVYLNLCVYISKTEAPPTCPKARSLVGPGYPCQTRWATLRLQQRASLRPCGRRWVWTKASTKLRGNLDQRNWNSPRMFHRKGNLQNPRKGGPWRNSLQEGVPNINQQNFLGMGK